jgi:phosphohistidine phosphatase
MKRLILVRHAKSSWSNSDISDKDRPLNDRGRDAATKVGAWLAAEGLQPDQVISSSAKRCRETWDGISPALADVADVQFEDFLYLASEQEMLSVLTTASGDCVLMLGHMPGLGDFARELRRDPPPMHEMFGKYPTGAVTVLDFRIDDWADVQAATGVFHSYVTPRELP